jgi:hypothetical protein
MLFYLRRINLREPSSRILKAFVIVAIPSGAPKRGAQQGI